MTGGVWRKPVVTPGVSGWAWSISCVKPGYCVAGGASKSGPKDDPYFGWLLIGKNGGGPAYADSISCAKTGRCALGGAFSDTTGFVTTP